MKAGANMMKKLLSLIATFTLASSAVLAVDDPTFGDFFYAEVTNQGITTQRNPADPTAANTFGIRDEITFKLVLVNRGAFVDDSSAAGKYLIDDSVQHQSWRFEAQSPATAIKPMVKVNVGGRDAWAEIDNFASPKVSNAYTTFNCTYKVKAGDMASPFMLANEDGKAVVLENMKDLWKLVAAGTAEGEAEREANLAYTSTDRFTPATTTHMDLGRAYGNIDLQRSAAYIKTVDFTADTEDITEGMWREVAKGGSASGTVRIQDANEELVSNIYVWTDSTEIELVDINGKAGSSVKITSFPNGLANFTIRTKDSAVTGHTATIYIGSTVDNALAVDTRKVVIGESVPENVTVSFTYLSGKPVQLECSSLTPSPAELAVKLSQTYSTDVTGKLVITLAGENPAGLLTVTKEGGEFDPTATPTNEIKFTIPANKKTAKFNVYPLGAVENWSLAANYLTATVVNTGIDTVNSLNFVLKPVQAKVEEYFVEDERLEDITLNANTDYTVAIKIDDSYRNLDSGKYSVAWYNTKLENTAVPEYDDLDAAPDLSGNIVLTVPEVNYDEAGTYETKIVITNPDGLKTTKYVTVNVQETPTIEAICTTTNIKKPSETDRLTYTFKLSPSAYSRNLRVYLEPVDEETKAVVNTLAVDFPLYNSADQDPILIEKGQTESDEFEIGFLDNGKAQFRIVVVNESGKRVSTYASKNLSISVNNARPAVSKLEVNGQTTTAAKPASVTVDVPATLKFTLNEGKTDGNNEKFWTKLQFFGPDGSIRNIGGNTYVIVKGAKNGAVTKEVTLNEENNTTPWTVKAYMMDKDRLKDLGYNENEIDTIPDSDWVEITTEFPILVVNKPLVTFKTDMVDDVKGKGWYENDYVTGKIDVELTRAAQEAVTIKVEIDKYSEQTTAKDLANCTFEGGTHEAKVTIPAGKTKATETLNIKVLDGTATSHFVLKTSVYKDVNATELSNAVSSPADYSFWVFDDDPTFNLTETSPTFSFEAPHSRTNLIVIALGEELKVSWDMGDVNADKSKFKVTWGSSEPGSTKNFVGDKDIIVDDKTVTKKATSNTYTTKFTSPSSEENPKMLYVNWTDGDGRGGSDTWYFQVDAAKLVTLIPVGPSGGDSASPIVNHYDTNGRGQGKVWIGSTYDKGILVATEDFGFRRTWSCGKDTATWINAEGYKAGDAQDTSYKADAGNDPVTPDPVYDSFFYAYLLTQGEEETTIVGSPKPGVGGNGKKEDYAKNMAQIKLPSEKDNDGNYAPTTVQAIFSKELYASDNCGDINCDGVPDWFVKNYSDLGVYDSNKQLVGDDMLNLAEASNGNPDDDYLPLPSEMGSLGIPGLTNTWMSAARAFTAALEIRGYGVGLNKFKREVEMCPRAQYLDFMAAGIKPEFNPTVYDAKTNPTGTLTELEKRAYDDRLQKWIADGEDETKFDWTPERPTDPTMEDTDGDGLSDGYEYALWYRAHVGYEYMKDGEKRYEVNWVGRKFDENAPNNPKDILNTTIEALYDPLIAISADDRKNRDTDNDGLSDYEEYALGTNPVDYDTDGDGIPDGWEVMAGLDPLNGKDGDGDNDNTDGDFMAYATCSLLNFKDSEDNEYWYIVDDDITGKMAMTFDKVEIAKPEDPRYTLADDVIPADVSISGTRIDNVKAITNGDIDSLRKQLCIKIGARNAVLNIKPSVLSTRKLMYLPADVKDIQIFGNFAQLIHDQVYEFYGFDPRTAWNVRQSGMVAHRWEVPGNPSEAGSAVKTSKFAAIDEFGYFVYQTQLLGKDLNSGEFGKADLPTFTKIWNASTSPATPDTDGDGIPDGWEAYVRRTMLNRTNGLNPHDTDIPNGVYLDTDGDDLKNVHEYAGLDSCEAYASCESIAKNYNPSWPNKFFPTDPNVADTDGDGLTDADEAGYAAYGYGNIEWGSTEVCHLGGGLNPCSIDTDCDGLPDGWEAQYEGISVLINGGYPYTTGAIKELIKLDVYPLANRVADGFNTDKDTGAMAAREGLCYITMGMDGTNPYDTGTTNVEAPATLDPATHTWRNYDFDFDGLENYQEYLVQSIRAFRYDDTETPLMGRAIKFLGDSQIAEFMAEMNNEPYPAANIALSDAVGPAYLAEAMPAFDISSDKDYLLRLKTLHPNFFQRIGGNGGNMLFERFRPAFGGLNSGIVVPEGYNWESTGYFADPKHDWDLAVFGGGASKYMYMPRTMVKYFIESYGATKDGVLADLEANDTETTYGFGPVRILAAAYVSTDPRSADTDKDGMDDYWELFHGLNPILGEADIIKIAYNPGIPRRGFDNAGRSDIAISATDNYWTRAYGDATVLPDAVKYPWLMGQAQVDADGDGLRNAEEKIAGNQTSPTTYHTDPTPAWMTDANGTLSYTRQYYLDTLAGTSEEPLMFPWKRVSSASDVYGNAAGNSINRGYLFAFEENEGYDTDGDRVADAAELTSSVMPASDPIDFTDPVRRQAAYFDGEASAMMTRYNSTVIPYDAKNMLTQFTVEAWVRPESPNGVIIERVHKYDPSTMIKDESHYRANFRIGLENGIIYGLYDSTDAVESGSNTMISTQRIEADVIPLNEWTHVAFTYDGTSLKLYVNDECKTTLNNVKLRPANGVKTTLVDLNGDYPVGNVVTTNPGAIILGASITDNFGKEGPYSFYDMKDYFKGFVDEVRVWDGARTADQIKADYKKRYSREDVEKLRDTVFNAWFDKVDLDDGSISIKASRNDNDGMDNLPAQLLVNVGFDQLPAATKPQYVAKQIAGYAAGVLDNCRYNGQTPFVDDIGTSWYLGDMFFGMRSKVYDDYHVIPHARNTAAQLMSYDGSALDSKYWGLNFSAGRLASTIENIKDFAFPNSMNVYADAVMTGEMTLRQWQLKRYATLQKDEEAALLYAKLAFDARSRFSHATDFYPFGNAYAKICEEMWDGEGPTDAWTDTGLNPEGNLVPDWYRDNVLGNEYAALTPREIIERYLQDIASGMQPNGQVLDEFASRSDTNNNGIPDWWENLHYLNGKTMDTDGDGLSDYAEYFINSLKLEDNDGKTIVLDPNKKMTDNKTIDYFRKVGELYLGEIFTDHDQVGDEWEKAAALKAGKVEVADMFNYDPALDPDDDGWTNYAEYRAGTDPTTASSSGLGGEQFAEFPIPLVKLTLLTDTEIDSKTAITVAAVRSDKTTEGYDAVWTVGEGVEFGEDGQIVEKSSEDSATNVTTKLIGKYNGQVKSIHLSPGSVTPGSVKINMYSPAPLLAGSNGQIYIGEVKETFWEEVIHDIQSSEDPNKGVLETFLYEEVGTVDYVTGMVEIDFSKLSSAYSFSGNLTNPTDTFIQTTYLLTDSSYFQASWKSAPSTRGTSNSYYLSDATTGYLREGKNDFVAFIDVDGNGIYEPGKDRDFGVARGVDVGWHSVDVTIQLTETNPIFSRISMTTGLTDRELIFGKEEEGATADEYELNGEKVRVRVIRTSVKIGGPDYPEEEDHAVIIDQFMDITKRSYLHEGDFIKNGEFDLDWSDSNYGEENGLMKRNAGRDIQSATYAIWLGNDGSMLFTNSTTIVRYFDESGKRQLPCNLAEVATVYGAHPTFRWQMPVVKGRELNTYTAFSILISKKETVNEKEVITPVYETPITLMPPKRSYVLANGTKQYYYTYTAPFAIGDLVADGVTIEANSEYIWEVSCYNSKFKSNTFTKGEKGTFTTKVNATKDINDHGYSAIVADVRYAGPSKVLDKAADDTLLGKIRVQAFTSPDFTGVPAGEGTAEIGADNMSAKVIGLNANGTYYVRAYIDSNGNHEKDDWESWGSFAEPVVMTAGGMNKAPVVTIYIDDADTDKDWVPDAYEYANAGWDGEFDAIKDKIGTNHELQILTLDDEFVNAFTQASLLTASAPGVSLGAFAAPSFAALLLSVDEGSVMSALEPQIKEDSVVITGFAIENGKVVLKVGSEVETASASGATKLYATNGKAKAIVQVLAKDNLAQNDWTVVKVEEVEIGGEDLVLDVEATGAFYKVVVTQK
ncbi:MAG: hypothetical protein MJ109_01650 [Kiritimatiellae bacterium]|nr:hypothetical protein [Kiritimatiellia bacterium]